MLTPVRVLVCDDRALYRKILRDVVDELPGARTVGAAVNGDNALQEVARLKPDLLLLDVEMPVMDGLTALKRLKKTRPDLTVVMVSSTSRSSADLTMQALEVGAVDFIEKPAGMNPTDSRRKLMTALKPVLALVRKVIEDKRRPMAEVPAAVGAEAPARSVARAVPEPVAKARPDAIRVVSSSPAPAAPREASTQAAPRRVHRTPLRVARPPVPQVELRKDRPRRFSVLAIGTSTGGPAALGTVIPALPADLGVPVVIVQHMPAGFTKSLAAQLDAKSALEVREAAEGDLVEPGVALIAPGGRHMEVVKKGTRSVVHLHEGEPVHNCRPSVDVLFESLGSADLPVLSLIMTGMGEDGSGGVLRLSGRGSYNLAQDEGSCVVYGMPRAVTERGLVHEVLPLGRIAARIREILVPNGVGR